jgi:hypothetical protein
LYQTFTTWPVSLQLTQNTDHRFLVTEIKDQQARAFGLTSTGLLDGTKWRPNPRVSGFQIFQVGVAPDGGVSWAVNGTTSNSTSKIYVQPLGSNGLPKGNPSVGGDSPFFVFGVDVTNVLPGNVRYLAFDDTDFATQTGALRLAVIDAASGKRLSAINTIDPSAYSQFVQNIALDPQGRFLIYSKIGSCNAHQLFYQALGANGVPSGSSKSLTDCNPKKDQVFLDIVEH